MLNKLHLSIALCPAFDYRKDMLSREQAANIHLLLLSMMERGVQGDVVELGCYVGGTSTVIAKVLHSQEHPAEFHVYDMFSYDPGLHRGVRSAFEANFQAMRLPLPHIHEGDIRDTLPRTLPGRIAFAHLDLGVGGDEDLHTELLLHALGTTYPRLVPGGIMVLMDYHLPGVTVEGKDANPGVRKACERFFMDKPEVVKTLYGGPCSHGYVRKS